MQSRAVDVAVFPPAQPADELPGLAQAPEVRDFLACHLHPDSVRLAERPHRMQKVPFAPDHSAARPVPLPVQLRKTLEFAHHGSRLVDPIADRREELHAAMGDRIPLSPLSAGRVLGTCPVHMDGMPGLHAFARGRDHRVGRRHDVGC